MPRSPNGIEESAAKNTLATEVYERLRDDLLHGALAGRGKLRIDWVVERYGVGASPVREALSRLAAENLLDRHDQRGFCVRPLDLKELEELTRTRCWLEERALRESIANRSSNWEEQVVLALHRLGRASLRVEHKPSSRDPDWESAHVGFHHSLISACGSGWLIAFCGKIADQMFRYRIAVTPAESAQRDCMTEHRLIAEAALDGDIDRAVEALVSHYKKSAETCKSGLQRATDSAEA